MPDADELSFYRVSVMTIVTSSLAHYSSPPTHTSAPVCGIVAYRFRLRSFGIAQLYAAALPCGHLEQLNEFWNILRPKPIGFICLFSRSQA